MPAQRALAFLFLAAVPLADALGEAALFLVVPLYLLAFVGLDAAVGMGPPRSESAEAEPPLACRTLLWAYIPAQLIAIAWGIAVAGGGASGGRIAGLALAIGISAGIFGIL